MTSKDALRAGEAVPLNAQWPGLEKALEDRSFKVTAMRAVATDMESYLNSMTGASNAKECTTGSLNDIRESCSLTEVQLGRWDTASAFTQSVGINGGRKLEEVYGEFIAAYEVTIRIIREQANQLEKQERKNENL
jgi:hypothetical protein